jgi:hypothetical protein
MFEEELVECSFCGYQMEWLDECQSCGHNYCEYCGVQGNSMCNGCEEWEEEDFE